MDQAEAHELVRQLVVTWPRPAMSVGTASVYREAIADLPADLTAEAIKRLRSTEDWIPSIAMIRRKVYGLAGFGPPLLDHAIEEAGAWLRYKNQNRFVNGSGYMPVKPEIHPVVLATVSSLGSDSDWEEGFRFVYRDNVETWKRQLLAMKFEEAKEMVFGE